MRRAHWRKTTANRQRFLSSCAAMVHRFLPPKPGTDATCVILNNGCSVQGAPDSALEVTPGPKWRPLPRTLARQNIFSLRIAEILVGQGWYWLVLVGTGWYWLVFPP